MAKQRSYSALGREYMHRMRNRAGTAEDRVDLSNLFSCTALDFLRHVFPGEGAVRITMADIEFDPSAAPHYSISRGLMVNPEFGEVWRNSDLPGLVGRLADSAYARYLHLNKHPEKTEKKIRNSERSL